MSIQYKINVLNELNKKGYTRYRLTKEKLLTPTTLLNLKNNEGISFKSLETICKLLHLQPGDIIMFSEDDEQPNNGTND